MGFGVCQNLIEKWYIDCIRKYLTSGEFASFTIGSFNFMPAYHQLSGIYFVGFDLEFGSVSARGWW